MTVYVQLRDQSTLLKGNASEVLTFAHCKEYEIVGGRYSDLLEIFDVDGEKVASFATDEISWWVTGKELKPEAAA